MKFCLTQDQQKLQDVAQKFCTSELGELAESMEKENKPLPREWLKQYSEMGFLGVNVPKRYGGLGMGNIDALIVLEEFAKISSAVAFPVFESSVGPIKAIEHFSPESVKKEIIPRVCSGDAIVAVAMSEENAGTALTDLKTKGEINRDKIIINGVKRWCSGGGHSDYYVVYCRLSDKPGANGIGAVLVEKNLPGVSFGVQEDLMGFRGIPSADIFFENVEVGLDRLIVPAGGFSK